jgi:hypothetical protein
MNVLDDVLGSCSKLRTDSCAAAKALVVFMFVSCMKLVRGRERGFFSSAIVKAAAEIG